jgi:hypothetical protein
VGAGHAETVDFLLNAGGIEATSMLFPRLGEHGKEILALLDAGADIEGPVDRFGQSLIAIAQRC